MCKIRKAFETRSLLTGRFSQWGMSRSPSLKKCKAQGMRSGGRLAPFEGEEKGCQERGMWIEAVSTNSEARGKRLEAQGTRREEVVE
jgi:hypothetical protein